MKTMTAAVTSPYGMARFGAILAIAHLDAPKFGDVTSPSDIRTPAAKHLDVDGRDKPGHDDRGPKFSGFDANGAFRHTVLPAGGGALA